MAILQVSVIPRKMVKFQGTDVDMLNLARRESGLGRWALHDYYS